VHPVAERHQRIQALLKFSRGVMTKRWIPSYQRDEMIDNYCRKHWALGQTTVRDYRKTVILAIQEEVECEISKQLHKLKDAPVPLLQE